MTLVRRLFRGEASVAYDDDEVSVNGFDFARDGNALVCHCGRRFTGPDDADAVIAHADAGHRYVIVLDEDTPSAFVVSDLFATLEDAKTYEAKYLNNDRGRRIVTVPGPEA